MVILSAQRKNSGLSLLGTNLDRSIMIEIQPMVSGEAAQVRAILIAGLTERWGCYDAGFNPDIEAFPESYRDALTLVARDAPGPVGTGTLKSIGQGQAEIVRMSVMHTHRQHRVVDTGRWCSKPRVPGCLPSISIFLMGFVRPTSAAMTLSLSMFGRT